LTCRNKRGETLLCLSSLVDYYREATARCGVSVQAV
jgi:hypothetical protein